MLTKITNWLRSIWFRFLKTSQLYEHQVNLQPGHSLYRYQADELVKCSPDEYEKIGTQYTITPMPGWTYVGALNERNARKHLSKE